MRLLKLFGLNLIVTVLVCGNVGPAASKLTSFGLVGWAAKMPFYLLQLYIAPAILLLGTPQMSHLRGAVLGLFCTLPLALWSVCSHCPPQVPIVYVLSGIVQGVVLTWLAFPRKQRGAAHAD